MEVRPSLGTASGKLTTAGETAKVRYENAVGGDIPDLMVLIDKIKRHKMSTDFVIVPATYIRNGKVVASDRAGAVLFYSNQYIPFGELVPNGTFTLERGERAGQTVERYKIVPSQLVARVDELFRRDRAMFDALSPSIKDAFIMGTLGAPDKFTPAVVDLATGMLKGVDVIPVDDHESEEERDAIDNLNDVPESDDDGAPY
jgi:hypothetical protein